MKKHLLKFQLANKEIQNSKILNNIGTWYKYFEYPHSNFYLREFQNLSVIPYPIFTQKPSIYLFSIIFIQECWIMTDSRILLKFDNFFLQQIKTKIEWCCAPTGPFHQIPKFMLDWFWTECAMSLRIFFVVAYRFEI